MADDKDPVNSPEISRCRGFARSVRERVRVRGRDDALDAGNTLCEESRESRQVSAFGVGVAREEDLEAQGVRAKHIMVRQLASQETGRALRGRGVKQARSAACAHGNDRVRTGIRTPCETSSRSIDSATTEERLETFGEFRGKAGF